MSVLLMLFNVEYSSPAALDRTRFTQGVKRRGTWVFLPQQVVCLEQRSLLSTFAATSHEPASLSSSVHAGRGRLTSSPPWTEQQNVSFRTVNGQTELLDVYTPDTPAPAGGYPVMVAIHGGGWHYSDKSAFGLRTAKVFTRDGYVVVAPNYVLSEPGNPTWPVNFEDVQAAVRWVRGDASTLDVNSNEIVAEGESAGANLAALLGVYSTASQGTGPSASVEAVVGFRPRPI